jgi:hypothetical protein
MNVTGVKFTAAMKDLIKITPRIVKMSVLYLYNGVDYVTIRPCFTYRLSVLASPSR